MKLRSKNDKTKLSKQQHNALWSGVTEKDFNNEVNVEDAEIGEFDKKHMLLFAANTNLFRQIVRLSDSLKPVERRILYSLYKLNCRPGTKTKSAIIVSNTMKFHCHGDCLAADTKFMLASGEIKTIKELYDSQQPVEVLSLDTNRKVRIATAHHFRIGQYTKRLYHIQLSNGQEIVCTNNHPIMVYTSGTTIDYIKAENLVVGDELYSGTVRDFNLEDSSFRPYIKMGTSASRFLQNIAADEIFGTKKYDYQIDHHKDECPMNNSTDNLDRISRAKHAEIHKDYLTGLELGRDHMRTNPFLKAKNLAKNKYLASELVKRTNLLKALRLVRNMIHDGNDLTIDEYERLRCDTSKYYNYPHIKTLIRTGHIRSFSQLLSMAESSEVLIKFDPSIAYSGIETTQVTSKASKNYSNKLRCYDKRIELFRQMIRFDIDLTRENFDRFNTTRTIDSREIDALVGFDILAEHTRNQFVFIRNIVIEESQVDIPMYDFTVDNLQNALIVTNQYSDSGYSMACVHNSPIYSSFVNLAQPWKRAVPLVSGKGNFGNAANPDLYAHYRYTEGCMSRYAWECFFDDYDEDCVETLFNSSSDSEEPMALPSKFPNILVNGGMGIAFGNSFRIPPYNINDIIDKCKAVLFNPNTVDLFMVPDFPCDCDIIDDGESLQSIIDTGEGSIKMRGRVEIAPYGQHWMLSITSVPWMCNLQSILDRVRTLAKAGEFSIIDIQPADYSVKMPDGSIQTKLDTRIIINKAHDPYVIRDKLYSTTDLEKTVSINFKVVTENLTIEKMNMRDLINSWIDERRSYKRRLYNKRLTKISARIELLSVLIYLLQKDNIEKTVKVIKNSNSSDLENQLMKLCAMSSYQAHKISEMRLSAFTKDARKRYEEERAKLEKEREEVLGIIRSEKKIDKIIASELDDLRKYATPRKTNIIQPTTEKIVSDTTHNVIVTKNGYIKKLHYNNSYSVNMGAFKAGDYPISRTIAHNMDSLIFFDSFGRYSIIPVHDIANNEPSQYGHQLFNTTKLSGTVVGVELYMNDNMIDELNKIGTPYLVTATARGYIKKTPLATYLEMRNTKNVKCMKVRDDDSLVYAGIILENTSILIYTKLGSYVLLDVNSITEQGKDNMGLMSIKMDPEDSLCGVTVIGKEDTDIVILTEKGNMKKCPVGLFGDVTKRTSIGNQYHMATLEVADKINCALGIKKDSGVIICTRTDVFKYDGSEIPEMTKKAKGKKLVSIPLGVTIINVFENPKEK